MSSFDSPKISRDPLQPSREFASAKPVTLSRTFVLEVQTIHLWNVCRSEVRQAEGVKIYFDPVSTAAREESARDLASKVLADPARKDSINTVRWQCFLLSVG